MSFREKIKAVNWNTPKWVKAYVTTRVGGVSLAPYHSFNLANHVNDNPESVKTNRDILKSALSLPSEPAWLNQTHSNRVKELTEITTTPIDADATFTRKRGIVCATFSADCVPILVSNKTGSLVAAIHAGWQGLANGVIQNTIQALGEDPRNCLAYIGPAICQSCYEVGAEVKTQFDASFSNCFTPSHRDQHYFMDTQTIAAQQLAHLGVLDTVVTPDCTSCLPDIYYSYRREGQTGRMAALIWLA